MEQKMTITPIPTVVNGIKFRSRLEARWSIFFSSLNLNWYYEYQGFKINDVWYLPDFLIITPSNELHWIEIKPFNETYNLKYDLFKKSIQTPRVYTRCSLLSGDPLDYLLYKDEPYMPCPRCGKWLQYSDCCGEAGSDRISVNCHDCDLETPSGRDNPKQTDGILPMEYEPYKGLLIYKKEDMEFYTDFVWDIGRKVRNFNFN